jgi:hypothetical protein
MPVWVIYVFGLSTLLLLGGGLAFTLWQFRRAAVSPRRVRISAERAGGVEQPSQATRVGGGRPGGL